MKITLIKQQKETCKYVMLCTVYNVNYINQLCKVLKKNLINDIAQYKKLLATFVSF